MVENIDSLRFAPRKVTRLTWGSELPIEFEPKRIVIEIDEGSAKSRFLDVGSLCYTRRINIGGKRCKYVVIRSYREDRSKVALIISKYLMSASSGGTAYNYYSKIVYFFNFIDDNNLKIDFDDQKNLIDIYERFTIHLMDRMRHHKASKNHISRLYASGIQIRVAELIGLTLGKFTVEILSTCVRIDQSGKTGRLPEPFEKQKKNVSTHLEIFASIADFLMSGDSLPLLIHASGREIIYYSQKTPSNYATNVACKARFLDWREVKENADVGKLNLSNSNNFQAWHAYKKTLVDFDKNRLSWRGRNLANKAIQAFQLAFIAVTAGNSSVVFGLNILNGDHNHIIHNKGMRYVGFKSRAGKNVQLEFGLKFKPYYEKYLAFRQWLLNELSVKSDLLFFSLKTSNGNFKNSKMILQENKTKYINVYKTFFIRYFSDVPWISPSLLRKGAGDYYLSETNNVMVTAQKLGNSINTVRNHYSKTSFEQAGRELSEFFAGVVEQAIKGARISDDRIPVNINHRHCSDTPSGHCSNQSEPILQIGFTSKAPIPNCNLPESCLFCKNYVLHADVHDVKKLLSMRAILGLTLSNAVNHEHTTNLYAHIVHRVDEILEYLLEVD